jgi:hypothetical protein
MVITQRFARISEQINRVEQALKGDKHLPALAQLVRKVQLEEKDKLLLVRRCAFYASVHTIN